MIITPSASLEYIAYIGLECEYDISKNSKIKFKVTSIKDLDDKDLDDATLNTEEEFPIEIDESKTLLEIEPIETDLTGEGYSLFRLKTEIFNLEEVVIIATSENKEYKIKDVEIEAYKDRDKYGESKEENNGILFGYPFSVEKEYRNLEKKSHTFQLKMKNDKCSTPFVLSDDVQTINITVNDNPIVKVNKTVKQAIVYSMENITPKRDLTNNIQIQMTIPVAPLIIDCKLKGDGDDEDDDEINYKDYIINNGSYILKFDDLNSNNEYKVECKFFTVNKDDDEIEIKIGNDKDYDFVTPLFPSRTLNSIPQCLEFIFKSKKTEKLKDEVKKFTDLSEKLCKKIMTKDEDVISRIEGEFKCKKAEFKEEIEEKKINRTIICLGASPKFKSKKFKRSLIDEKDSSYFDEHVEKFVGLINTTEKIKKAFKKDDVEDIEDLELVEFKRYYDLESPDQNKIILDMNKKEGTKKKDKLEFTISSINAQPIQCFYNKELRKDNKKRFMNLYFNRGGEPITLYPNEKKTIKVELSDSSQKKMYTLYMNCYNLPGAKIRYEQTGVFNAYTYLYVEEELEQYVIPNENVTINCAEKNNRINPHCMKGQYNSLLNRLKTKMPQVDIDEEIEKFNKLSNQAQLQLLINLQEEWEKEINKLEKKTIKFFDKLIYMAQYLANRDCSVYVSGKTNSLSETINNPVYKKCRETKKEVHKKLIEKIKDHFKCDNIIKLIGKDGLSTDVEDNIKYIIYLIQELSSDPDSFNKGESEVLYDVATCFEQNFDIYWSQVEEFLKESETLDQSIIAIKKDLANLLIQSLANLIKVLHFEEIDGYILNNNSTKSGLMRNEKGEKIYQSMKEFMKYFNEFGTGEYNLSDSIIINVTINEEYEKKENENNILRNLLEENNDEENEHVIKYDDKGIMVILKPKLLMKQANAYSIQVVRYDSPIMSIKTSGDKDDSTLDTFVSITLYDKDGNEIKVDDLPKNIRPKIIYNRSYHKYIKHCFFYNENTQDLEESGLTSEDNFNYNGKKYFTCSTKHLTSFTAGNYYSPDDDDDGIGTAAVVLIVLGCILLLAVAIFVICYCKRKSNDNIETIKKDNSNMEIMS